MTDPLPAAQQAPPSLALRYLVAVVAPVVVVAVTLVVQQSIAPTAAPIFSLAIAVAALYGGWGAGIVASILSILGYLFFPGLIAGPAGMTRLVQFLVVATGITGLGGFVYRQRWLAVAQAGENARLRRTAEAAASEAQEAMAVAEEETLKAEQFASDASDAAHEAQVALDARMEAESRLHAGATRLAAIVDSSNDAIISKTLEGVITSWNRAAERIFGYQADEIVGRPIFTLIPEEHQAAEREVLERLSRGEAIQNAEVERVRKDGRRIWISLSVSPLRDQSGRIVGAASIKRDVTEEKLAADRLRETQRLRVAGQLAGGIAHEANNQMLVVLGAADFILKRADLPIGIRQDLAAIRQAAERTAAITQQLLAFSRRQPVSIKNVDVDAVIREMQPVIRRTLQEQHELSFHLDLGETWVRVDARQLEQVLLNLTLNARDAMPDGGRLTIRTFRVPASALPELATGGDGAGYACIAVEDTGTGMESVTLERAFEPFFTTKGVGQGTGLGLSVVDGLTHQMGGTIRVASVVGKGSTFTLYLPLVSPVPASTSPGNASAVAAGDGRVVLVVEDEANVRTIAARTLREAGYTVHEAQHGGEALDLIRGGTLARLDLVITDLGMPVMRGETLATHLRTERPDVPVLYISGYTDSVAVAPFLQKPFAPDQLLREVGNLLRAGAEADLRPPSAGVA